MFCVCLCGVGVFLSGRLTDACALFPPNYVYPTLSRRRVCTLHAYISLERSVNANGVCVCCGVAMANSNHTKSPHLSLPQRYVTRGPEISSDAKRALVDDGAGRRKASFVPRLLYTYPLLKISFLLTFVLFLVLLIRHVMLLQRPFQVERYERKTDLAQSQIRPGLNIDNLPVVKIDYGKYRPTANVPGDENENDTNDKSDETISVAQIKQLCLTRGYYLGPENTETLCGDVCNVADDEVTYVYITASEANNVLVGRQRLRQGGYCMPTLMSTCNRNTSSVVYSMNGWICLPRTDAFAGEGGNRIVVCNGSLRDNALRVVYRNTIPSNLAFTDVYRDRLADGTYRFECLHNERDRSGNLYLQSSYNRLHTLTNWCTFLVPFATGVTTDLARGECHCGEMLTLDASSGRCTACAPAFDRYTKQIAFHSQPCYSFNDSYYQFAELAKSFKKRNNLQDNESAALMPCGYNTQGNTSEYTLPRCLSYNIALYQPILPSHNTLNTIDAHLG